MAGLTIINSLWISGTVIGVNDGCGAGVVAASCLVRLRFKSMGFWEEDILGLWEEDILENMWKGKGYEWWEEKHKFESHFHRMKGLCNKSYGIYKVTSEGYINDKYLFTEISINELANILLLW